MMPTQKDILIAVVEPDALIVDISELDVEYKAYAYSAKLYFKQFTEEDTGDLVFVKDYGADRYLAAPNDIVLVSSWDLSILGYSPIILPCINKSGYYESLLTVPPFMPDTTVTELRGLDEDDYEAVSANFGKSLSIREEGGHSAAEIYEFFDAPDTPKSLAEIITPDEDDAEEQIEPEQEEEDPVQYKILVRIEIDSDEGEPNRPYVGYMPIGKLGALGEGLPAGISTGDIIYWDAAEGKWEISAVGTPVKGDILVWDGSKYEKKKPSDLLRYDTATHQLQIDVGGTWTMITGGQAAPFP